MSEPTVRVKVDFNSTKPWAEAEQDSDATETPTRAARLLALAHHVERQLLVGKIPSYAHAARQLGMSAPQLTHVLNLLNLSPAIQERILTGDLRLSERRLREVAALAPWSEQHVGSLPESFLEVSTRSK